MSSILNLAIKNLVRRKKRAALTMLGVFIGIAAVVALVSLGQGLQKTINDQFEKVGADKVIIEPKGAMGIGGEAVSIGTHEQDIVKKVNGVINTAGAVLNAVKIQYNKIQRTHYSISLPKKQKEAELLIAVYTMEAEKGRMLASKDKNKVVIGSDIGSKNLFKKNVKVGEKVLINDRPFEVVGILKKMGDPVVDTCFLVSEEDARKLVPGKNYDNIIAQTATGESPDAVADRIEKAIRKDRHQEKGKENFSVKTSTELIESFNKVFNIIQVVFVGIAAISLIVGGIGIMNTMYTAVLERTREIGVMKSIGARNSEIVKLFIVESGFLGMTGGIIGVAIGAGLSKMIEVAANYQFGAGTITAVFPLYLTLGAILFSGIVGMVSGVMPAYRASRLSPVEALRYE